MPEAQRPKCCGCTGHGRRPGAQLTRFKPPADLVKLEDRLYYVLQPALETLLGDGALSFPFHPFPYQMEGVAFMYPRVAAVLADEMGLGKTMQAITSIRLLLHAGELRSVLLVCPKPLVTNWKREFAQWAPEIPLTVIEGDQAKRQWQWQLADAPVKIANYELLQRDRQNFADGRLKFDLVVLDEAQRIKNQGNSTSQVVRAIERRRSWALTGTPIENSPDDLVGIFEFLAPGTLNSDMKPRQMGRVASEFVLRRTKDKVLTELPAKTYRDADVELSAEQRHTYEMAENEGVLRLTEMGDSATIQHVFELVLRLKQICNFDPVTDASSKLERLEADLEEVAASGRKAIVFSQWVSTLTKLSKSLSRFGTLEYHGQIPTQRRDGVIEEFRNNKRKHVMLISYGAGGVGLNLQFSEYVFLFDRWWNPAIEDQAINRAHRIGAVGPVPVRWRRGRGGAEKGGRGGGGGGGRAAGGRGGRGAGGGRVRRGLQLRHGGADELQPGDRRRRQGADRPRDRRPGRGNGPGDRRHGHSVPHAQSPQGPGHAQPAGPGRQEGVSVRSQAHRRGAGRARSAAGVGRGSLDGRVARRAAGRGSARSRRRRLPGARGGAHDGHLPAGAHAHRRSQDAGRSGGRRDHRRASARALHRLGLSRPPLQDRHAAAAQRPHDRLQPLRTSAGRRRPAAVFVSHRSNRTASQVPCWITYTNAEVHDIIRANLDRAPMYSGQIKTTGPRYCPSIEDKVVRFADKDRHQLFLEPEGRQTREVYVNGISTSLPRDVQDAILRRIPGLENAQIMRYGYAVEYDFCPPDQLWPSLETKRSRGAVLCRPDQRHDRLRRSGRARADRRRQRGLKLAGGRPLVLDRSQAYIGVLIDDLVTCGVDEPYRMFTSRAEYRLLLRHDNADRRLTPVGSAKLAWSMHRTLPAVLEDKLAQIEAAREILAKPRGADGPLDRLLKRPEIGWTEMVARDPELAAVSPIVAEQVVYDVKYAGYVARQEVDVARQLRLSAKTYSGELRFYQECLICGSKLGRNSPRCVR